MKLEQTWRWYGPHDPVTLKDIRQAGASGIVTALHHIPNGQVWPLDEIKKRKNEIESAGLRWSVVESIPVHEDIKRRNGTYSLYIENYKKSIANLAACGIGTVCYNFMPVLDWTRTDLHYPAGDGSTALRFEEPALAAFDLYILEREHAGEHYSSGVLEEAKILYDAMDNKAKQELVNTILAGLPGSEEAYTLDEFREIVNTYHHISEPRFREHLYLFLKEIIPAAEENGVRMAIHPDDPPFSLFGLPRIVSTEADAKQLLDSMPSPCNGLTFCTGSYGARPDNDLPGMVKRLGSHIHFIHLRSVERESNRTFHEANHLEGSTDMPAVMYELINEQIRRKNEGRMDLDIPMRPDHGHRMIYDFSYQSYPGYSCTGRLRGLAELRGLELGIRRYMRA